jgi:demethylmenaquinone methyltransferase/2-methoxy-6-polyprenyl-1,4-benzoquinol methylase
MKRKTIWKAGQESEKPSEMPKAPDQTAQFGYQRIPRDEKSDRVLRHFDAVAKKYDLMNSLLSLGIHHIWKRKAIKQLALLPGDRVLDVCGGTGDLSILSAKAVGPSGKIVLYDFNANMMAAGQGKVTGIRKSGEISYIQGDAECMSFSDHSFDAAMVGFGIRNLTHMDIGFEEMYRVLKPGGKMLCLEFSKPTFTPFRWLYDFYSFYIMPYLGEIIVGNRQAYLHLPESIRTFPLPDALKEMLEGIGFTDVSYQKLTNGIAVIHMARK